MSISMPETCESPADHVAKLQADVEALQQDVVGMEHRLVQVARNAYWALTKREGWPASKRLEAGAALVRYLFMGRPLLVVSVGLGGLLALHASFMLADQNRKLDLQNHLAIVSGEIAEAQRNSQFAQLIPPLLSELNDYRARTDSSGGRAAAATPMDQATLNSLYLRVAVLTQTFQPYRWIDRRVEAKTLLHAQGSGALFNTMQAVRGTYDAAFGTTLIESDISPTKMELPLLTAERYSPERGLLLVNLFAARVSIPVLTRFNVTFERTFAPGARLDGIDLGTLVGPSLSTPLDLSGSYLARATFLRAKLEAVLFAGANLHSADLRGANATGTKWAHADLSMAQLDYANFQRANMPGARLDGASLIETNLAGADLSGTQGLAADQFGQACIDIKTTVLPKQALPASYKVPPACCDRWAGSVNGFARRADGECVGKGD